MNLDDWKCMIYCEIERFSCCDLIEFNQLRIGDLYNSDYIQTDCDLLLTHKLDYIMTKVHFAPAILGLDMFLPS